MWWCCPHVQELVDKIKLASLPPSIQNYDEQEGQSIDDEVMKLKIKLQ